MTEAPKHREHSKKGPAAGNWKLEGYDTFSTFSLLRSGYSVGGPTLSKRMRKTS
jgi:hypothetical protein